ncbi:MAG: hypothetical protein MZW92_35160 [Comamonadaceae bacterium]|nr:hypothetical protein [Comamonadaceae bacterium]
MNTAPPACEIRERLASARRRRGRRPAARASARTRRAQARDRSTPPTCVILCLPDDAAREAVGADRATRARA